MVVSYNCNKVLPDFGGERGEKEREGREKLHVNIFVWGD